MMKKEKRVFISYSKIDKDKALELYREIKDAGFFPWIDSEDLHPGQKWEYEIEQVMRNYSTCVVLCLSDACVQKRGFFYKEMKIALDIMKEIPTGEIFIIPVRFDDCEVPFTLKSYHYVDLFENKNETISKLIDTITKITAQNIDKLISTIKDTFPKGSLKRVSYRIQCAYNHEHIFKKIVTIEEGSKETSQVPAYCPYCEKHVYATVNGKVVPDESLLR